MAQGVKMKEELLAEFEAEYERIQARIRENQQLIDQSQLEVDQLRDRNVTIGTQLNRVESNFDTIPRADIKSAYDSALDAKSRLLSMQGQLDKLKGNQQELLYFQELLGRLLNMLRGVRPDQLPSPAPGGRLMTDMYSSEGGLSTKAIVSMVEAQEDERQRLARQMHDGPAQSLSNFILQTEICWRLFEKDPDAAGEELKNLKNAASTIFQRVRDFIFDLRPMILDDLGLVPTVKRYIDAFREKTNIETTLKLPGDERRLPSHIEVMMFRAIQTVLGAARDHLNAQSITVVLDVGLEWLKVTIEHDGRGFDIEQLFNAPRSEDVYGLRTLRDRIELVGGSMEIHSASDADNSRYLIMLPAKTTG